MSNLHIPTSSVFFSLTISLRKIRKISTRRKIHIRSLKNFCHPAQGSIHCFRLFYDERHNDIANAYNDSSQASPNIHRCSSAFPGGSDHPHVFFCFIPLLVTTPLCSHQQHRREVPRCSFFLLLIFMHGWPLDVR